MTGESQKDFSKNVNVLWYDQIAYSIGFDAGLGLELGLDVGKRIHGPIGVREAVYLCKPLYLGMPLYL